MTKSDIRFVIATLPLSLIGAMALLFVIIAC